MSRYKTIDEGVFVVRPLVNVDERYKAKNPSNNFDGL